MQLVLFQPEIPQNVGTLMRFAACMGMSLNIIEPCGFLFTDKHLKRAGMDYIERAVIHRSPSWKAFCEMHRGARRIAVTGSSAQMYHEFSFEASDLLIMGQESVGFPEDILIDCHETVGIPMVPGLRSLNLALAAAIVTTEALRQTHQLPGERYEHSETESK
ncbi:MAG: tRNA (cytidine(34)-2'-O)-methyltransferase [Proteobacteria bacterium]|nr:tRNA (cytidine(34)-2'-O)-methyltransferase [Pseudomonadota bacterium]